MRDILNGVLRVCIFFEEGSNRVWKIMRKEYILRIILDVTEYN